MPSLSDYFRSFLSNSQDPSQTLRHIANAGEVLHVLQDDQAKLVLTHIIMPWVSTMAAKALPMWSQTADIQCQSPAVNLQCPAPAICVCHACGRPVCLNHAFISIDAYALCFLCTKNAVAHATPWKPERRAPKEIENIDWAYEILGISPDATDSEVKKAYREKSAHCHPDAAGADSGKAKLNADLFKTIQKARRVIMDRRKNE